MCGPPPVRGLARRNCAAPYCDAFAYTGILKRDVVAVHIIGAGLAGTEAAWQVAHTGLNAILYEMRPIRMTPAHKTDQFAELVCSNSLKSEAENTAPWLLKQELRRLGSAAMTAADMARVPGGHALTVDRNVFSGEITRLLEQSGRVEIRREEVVRIPAEGAVIIA